MLCDRSEAAYVPRCESESGIANHTCKEQPCTMAQCAMSISYVAYVVDIGL
jgi:hypothetical protein